MKIELIYDPVKPDLSVCIDGQLKDDGDIFGFLYPVRGCLLQTWVTPSGSWNGLVQQIRELARGEQVELTFRGRDADYQDLLKVMDKENEICVRHSLWNPLAEYTKLLDEAEKSISGLLSGTKKDKINRHDPTGVTLALAEAFPENAQNIGCILKRDEIAWCCDIETDADFWVADKIPLSCCVVSEEYLDSYEKLERLATLTRSMRRNADMICCCFGDGDTREDFVSYACQYPGLAFRFVDKADSSWKTDLKQKYGEPFILRSRLRYLEDILEELEKCIDGKDSLNAQRDLYQEHKAQGILTEQEEVLWDQVKVKSRWIKTNQEEYENVKAVLKRNICQKEKELTLCGN